MNRTLLYVIIIVIIALAAWVYFRSPKPAEAPVGTNAIGAAAGTADTVKATMPAAVDSANPFTADVNPTSGYKNPFGQ